ncbi:MAG TPA: 2-oxoglutarate dehydrogenase E1 component [Verrucomicrobia subdivision 3 bacterium]|nr:2-oxoglutarate dehydrogenase E1 component [Limisphaerales bacterium]
MANGSTTLSHLSLAYLEGLYADYLRDPASAPPEWQRYFAGLTNGEPNGGPAVPPMLFRHYSVFNPPPARRANPAQGGESEVADLQERVDSLIRSYRSRGHIIAQIDPLRQPKAEPPELDPAYHGLTAADLDRQFACATMEPDRLLPLREIIERLRSTYCRSIGVQFMHIDDYAMRYWLQERMERTQNRLALSRAEQLRILTRLTDAVVFEEFIRKKFIGAKSFSLEGSESLIPLLDLAIEHAGEQGVTGMVLGMAHRGRLNVLANILGKSPRAIFREFADTDPKLQLGGGDVKYHLGHDHDYVTAVGRTVHLSLCSNPSHLEFVNPVAAGRVRVRQDCGGDTERNQNLLLLIHGDAAFMGEGVVQETLNLSRLPGYTVGGALHIIVNNQIGFTTSPNEGRSSMYATSVAKMLPTPIFHVNGEDPEAVAQCVQLALAFRAKFKLDVVIDMYAYRRLGHNEGDEPTFTQPVLYRRIAERKPVREGYLDYLLKLGEVTQPEADEIAERRHDLLEQNLAESRRTPVQPPDGALTLDGKKYDGGPEPADEIATGVDKQTLAALLDAQTQLPAGFQPHPKIQKILETRREMAAGRHALDWAAAESLAFATLATKGVRVRLSGQDCGRGTFSHRHAVLHDFNDGHLYTPLQHLAAQQSPVEFHNSPLSETGVLGFEYGYSLDCPDGLTLWEAQFGDFVNAAQVIVDQFIISGEKKWGHLSGLVLLLPHGWEGMGPEHSSARLERFLRLAAEDNIQVANPTTPAQYFHLLRRQALRRWRKPLVVMTPKSLLRHPVSVSSLDDLATGRFQRIIPETPERAGTAVKRVLLCSGKIYFELAEHREKLKCEDVAIVRVEQLYPLPTELLQSALAPYRDRTPVFWVQEEPENMGAWYNFRVRFGDQLFGRWPFAGISRPASASPACGSANAHRREQADLVAQAFGENL